MRKFLTLLLCLLVTPAFAQSWIANAPNQSIPFNNNGYLGYINWTNGCILTYQTGTASGTTGGFPVCTTAAITASMLASGAAAGSTWNPPLSGGVSETISKTLSRIIWVDQYGADPTGVADSTAALNNLLSLSGVEIHLTCGATYELSAALNMTGLGSKLYGCSSAGTYIRQGNLSANILNVIGGNNVIDGIMFEYGGTATAGYAVNNTGYSNIYRNFQIWNAYIGFYTTGISNTPPTFLNDFQINNSVMGGISLANTGDFYASHFIINCGSATNCALGGIRLFNHVEAAVFTDGDVLQGVYSLTTDASTYVIGSRPAYSRFTNVFFDSSAQGSLINNMVESEFIGTWWSSGKSGSGYAGLTITNSDSLKFTNNEFFNNGCHGAVLGSGANQITFSNSSFESNSVTSGPGVCHGLIISPGISNWSVIGGTAGNGLYTGQQGYGILINSGSSNNYTVSDVLCSGNTIAGGSDGGTGTNKTILSPGCAGFTNTVSGGLLATSIGSSGTPVANGYFTSLGSTTAPVSYATFSNIYGPSGFGLSIVAASGQSLSIGGNGATSWSFDASKNFLPTADNVSALGSNTIRISNAYITTAKITPVAIASLPTCNSTNVGDQGFVNNGVTAPTYHLAVSSTGTGQWPVYCTYNGTTYSWVY